VEVFQFVNLNLQGFFEYFGYAIDCPPVPPLLNTDEKIVCEDFKDMNPHAKAITVVQAGVGHTFVGENQLHSPSGK
jgi:hypothetical protein